MNFDHLEQVDHLTTLELRPPLSSIMSALVDLRELDTSFRIDENARQLLVERVRDMKVSLHLLLLSQSCVTFC